MQRKPSEQSRTRTRSTKATTTRDLAPGASVTAVVAALERMATRRTLEALPRYAIPTERAFGVSMADLKALAKRLGRDHELAASLWETGWYEARMLATLIDDPELVTAAQMDRWCKDFDSWAICDTACFQLFDRTPLAWKKLGPWSKKRGEFEKRAAFALLASLALHDKRSGDAPFLAALALVERAADDERNFVKKGVSWALRAIGERHPTRHAAAVALARRLAAAPDAARRWVGRDALRELTKPAVLRRLAARGPVRSQAQPPLLRSARVARRSK